MTVFTQAIVEAINLDILTLRWRDYPDYAVFEMQRIKVGLHP
jgi:hypothetical protein